MPVTVTDGLDGKSTFDNADTWEVSPEGHLNVIKEASNGGVPKILGTYHTKAWDSVKKDIKQDRQLLLEEAIELIRAVDNGNFGNQDSDWQDRAEALINSFTSP